MPFAPVNSVFGKQSQRIEEVLGKSIEFLAPKIDPIWEKTVATSQGVGAADRIGRDMKIIKQYQGGLAGVIEDAYGTQTWQDERQLYGGNYDQYGPKMLRQLAPGRMFPDAFEGAQQNVFELGIPMRAITTNIGFTLGEMTAEANPNTIGEIIAPKMKGFAKYIMVHLSNAFYASQNNGYSLSSFTLAAATLNNTDKTLTFTPLNQATNRFFTGMRIDLHDDSTNVPGTTRYNLTAGGERIRAFVSAVNHFKNTVTIQFDPATPKAIGTGGSEMFNGATAVIWVLPANSQKNDGGAAYRQIAGYSSWLKAGTGGNDNYLLGAERDQTAGKSIDVTVHPEFMSMKVSNVGTLTEHKLRLYLTRFHAFGDTWGVDIDTVLASDGVWLNYEAQKIGMQTIDRTGRLSSLANEGSKQGFTFQFDGKTYNGRTSRCLETGVVLGLKTGGNNWKRYVVPDPKGGKNNPDVPSFIPFKFVMPMLTGGGSNQWPYTITENNTTVLTEGVQMPGWIRMQLVPDQVNMMRLEGVAEDRFYVS